MGSNKREERIKQGKKKVRESGKKGRKQLARQKQKFDYYNENREELVEGFLNRFRNSKDPAVTGLIVVAPILATYFIVYWLINKIKDIPGHQILNLTPYTIVNDFLKLGFSLIALSIIVTGVGRFVMTQKGFKAEKKLDSAISSIPVISGIHNVIKVSLDTIFQSAEEFQKPVKMDFNGLRATGFKTGNKTDDGRDIIFLPTAPNITSGFVLEVDEDRYMDADETVEESLARILSAGFGDSNNSEEDNNPE